MNNYEYIITSLPDITTGWKFGEKTPEDYIEEITSLCSEKDKAAIAFLLEGFDDSKLAPEFYIGALTHKDRFIREYFIGNTHPFKIYKIQPVYYTLFMQKLQAGKIISTIDPQRFSP